MAMDLKKFNNLLTSGKLYSKDLNDDHILALVGVAQKMADDSNKSSEKSNTSKRDTTKVDTTYIRDIPTLDAVGSKRWNGKQKRMENNTVGARNTTMAKDNGSTTIQKTTGSGPVPHQLVEEVLKHQVRETATRIWPSPRTSNLAFLISRTKEISKPSCSNSTLMPRETSRPGTVAQRLKNWAEKYS